MSQKIMLSIFMLLVTTAGFAAPVQQEADGRAQQPHQPGGEVIVQPDEVVIIVQGIVCSFCAQGLIRKLSRLAFIDPSRYRKGVKVEIENQRVTLAIRPEQTADWQQVFQSIRAGGYEPVDVYINVGKHQAVRKSAQEIES